MDFKYTKNEEFLYEFNATSFKSIRLLISNAKYQF